MKRRRRSAAFLAAVLLSVSLAGCGEKSITPTSGGDAPGGGSALSADAGEHFAAVTGAELLSGAENRCYSPVSLYLALAMAGAGAAGETQAQIYTLLGAENTDTLAAGCKTMLDALQRDEKDSKLYLANSVWTRQGIETKPDYQTLLEQDFSAESFSVPFGQTRADGKMSAWVEQRTRGLLKPKFQHEADTVAVLLNTIYFKDGWTEPFSERNTENGDFTTAGGEIVRADFMQNRSAGLAREGEDYRKGELSFRSGGSMFFVLPDEDVPLQQLLAERGLQELLTDEGAQSRDIDWWLPKFRQGGEVQLIDLLRSLGVTDAFDADAANFSNGWDTSAYISEVRQGTALSVDENGVEAAAYTEISMKESAALVEPESPLEMRLDRPFLYGVRGADGTLVFVGVCADPTREE
ncbi:MAG: hypothetical protein MR004_05205 [Clostridiales bacterium]|nr:hypothetical protein [Clostridiales bacterium]MDY4036485.1 serpin family protein [Candidatus Pseudoscilispira sp.]